MMHKDVKKTMLTAQKNEITEHFIYEKLSKSVRDPRNRSVLGQISRDELSHYNTWMKYTNEDVKPDKLKIWMYLLISRIFGITFGTKLMERGEEQAQVTYKKISKFVPEAKDIAEDEDDHEKKLIDMMDEERLRYVGSVVRGLSDALVELSGALAGFTLALKNTRLVAMVGLITGVAASLSMAASEYLATKSEEGFLNPFKASFYTSIAYILTVLCLIFPYLFFTDIYLSLGLMIFNAIIIIFIFTFYISVSKDVPFTKRFLEMVLISLGIAVLAFAIGYLIRITLNVDI